MRTPSQTAALAGVPAGVQAVGPWTGRRQLFIRFAAEAETATLYTADALAEELKRLTARSAFHSVAVGGRDPLGGADFLAALLERWTSPLPVMLDTDGQRPEALERVLPKLALVQVSLDPAAGDAVVERALQTLLLASRGGVEQALVLLPGEGVSDGQLLRIVEQTHAVSRGAAVVVHPVVPTGASGPERRWATLLEQASGLHADVRLLLRLAPPLGMR
ncbi:MAG TPA: hypothetical protein VNA89_11715 [Gemmatimonadaceae bacterium]|nr:hypothetical protein [Gemmatimonadaceae bacterium]